MPVRKENLSDVIMDKLIAVLGAVFILCSIVIVIAFTIALLRQLFS